ncbi:unnamed protein product [Cuscuta campestris]|uniref:Uncharacterized protein n=2 Tax=Cuscuta sect. Cleistogrammica TaxID=1824901 RepID=A0A484KA40_9ASTE|nr:hypothetical protein DM860_006638 [Cuscuta australis]VFQ62310.1 unnamed protein product [Cuscuta campestris]
MKVVLIAILLLLALVLGSSASTTAQSGGGSCDDKCEARCSKAGFKDRCTKYCGICCKQCNCVPSGTYGNKHECPCYRDLKNKKGKPKCP